MTALEQADTQLNAHKAINIHTREGKRRERRRVRRSQKHRVLKQFDSMKKRKEKENGY